MCGFLIVRLLSFLFLDDFEGSANISVAIKSGSRVLRLVQENPTTTNPSHNICQSVSGVDKQTDKWDRLTFVTFLLRDDEAVI